MYDCTHCFKCIEACPKGVAPMSQIMRLRRRGRRRPRHQRPQQRPPPRDGVRQEHPPQRPAARGRPAARLLRRQVRIRPRCPSCWTRCRSITEGAPAPQGHPRRALLGPSSHKAPKDVKAIFEAVEGREDRVELNLYLTGYDEDVDGADAGAPRPARRQRPAEPAAGQSPEERPTR